MSEFIPTPHPVLQLTPEFLLGYERAHGAEAVRKFLLLREETIKRERLDPLRYGWEAPETTGKVRELIKNGARYILLLGGNRSGKTETAAKLMVETLTAAPRRRAWFAQETEAACRDRQQPYIYRYLPPEWRDAGKKGSVTYVKYTQQTGFADGHFVLPNGSWAGAMNYKMALNNFEGEELDFCWPDELCPFDIAETLRYRVVTRGGILMMTFTPKAGYTQTVKAWLDTARVIETRPAPLLPQDRELVPGLPKGHMPYVLQCTKPGNFIVCFFSEWNPYGGYENLAKELFGELEDVIKVRAYGWPTKAFAGAFPLFSDAHLIAPEKIPAEGTNYFCVDPAGARGWFMLWLRVDYYGRIYVYREWPGIEHGAWAEPSNKADGKPGPAQTNCGGMTVAAAKEIILKAEGKASETAKPEAIQMRIIDPRAANNKAPNAQDTLTLGDHFAAEQIGTRGQVLPPMVMVPAPAGAVEEGIELINNQLGYDPKAPRDGHNCPNLYISTACTNLIDCMRIWTGADGQKGASKDPIDCLRYALCQGVHYIEEASWTAAQARRVAAY
jgi:hypothetical protein